MRHVFCSTAHNSSYLQNLENKGMGTMLDGTACWVCYLLQTKDTLKGKAGKIKPSNTPFLQSTNSRQWDQR